MAEREPIPVAAVDLGGTKLYLAEVDESGDVRHGVRRATQAPRGADAVVEEIVAAYDELRSESGITSFATLGVGVAGQVHPKTGAVRLAPNLGWKNFPLRQRLEEALGIPVAVINDVQAAALGEALHGAGRDTNDMAAIFVGTGVGGGIVNDGRLVLGCGGSAGEIGHITIDRNGPECRCGNHGCLEAFAGGWAIGSRARSAALADETRGRQILDLVNGDPDAITAEIVAAAALEGDRLARGLIDEAVDALGVGIATLANLYNPCAVVLGGGVVEGIEGLVERIGEVVRRRALASAAEQLSVRPATLGPHAGAVGAAEWARTRLRERGSPG